MKRKMRFIYLFSVIVLGMLAFTSCDKNEDDPNNSKSSEKQIISFMFNDLTPAVTAVIDHNLHTITAIVPAGTILNNMTPTITFSEKASISPASGSAVDFTNPVVYTVVAEDLSTNNYIVTVTTDASEPEVLSGLISENRTLPNVNDGIDYIIDGWLHIDGNALLTIDPGVKIVFTSISSGIEVDADAGLKINGTLEMPVILTGPVNNNNKGAWYGIEFNSSRDDNMLNFVQVINAGATNGSRGAVVINSNAKLAITNSIIERSGTTGLYIDDAKLSEFTGNTIKDCDNYPIEANNMMNLQTLTINNAFIGNVPNMVYVSSNPKLLENCIFKAITVPYLLNGFASDANVEIEAGVVLKFISQKIFDLFPSSKLTAIGTATAPIVMEGLESDAGYWGGIYLDSNRDNVIDYLNISGGGYEAWNMHSNISMWEGTKLTISNSVLRNSSGYGFQYSNVGSLIHSNVTFENCSLGNVYDYENDVVYTTLP